MNSSNVRRIAVKELFGFFSSFTALLFFGAFLAVTLFFFFWIDTFFARNIADVRPMFDWMPVLLVFLVPSLTMRMWSEERRSGTIEFLLTVPVSNLELVFGKFIACMGLIAIALALTLPIPITVALLLGQLDWGPVVGGYIAALFLAASYIAIGLNISSRTDNQIVSLLLSVLVCGLFLLIGSDGITSLFNNNIGELLKLLGSGSRFQSITRGVIDFRDLYYYLSIAGVFLSLNVLGLEKLRWAGNRSNAQHRRWAGITVLCIANFIACNFWLHQVAWARVDLTDGQIYSISEATRKYLSRLNEPLLIRGYFSRKTHPLLQPLIPRLRDLLKEYAIAGKGRVRVEFIDPLEKPELEKEAVEKYGIKPVAFQTTSKYQASLTNSYFDVLIKYGDQFQKLSWKDLIEVKARSEQDVQVDLRNPEYDITSTIKKVLYSYQSAGNLFLGIEQPVTFTGYVSRDDQLPEPLLKLKQMLVESLDELKKQSNGKFSFEFVDPDSDGGKLAKKLESDYGFRPMALGLFDTHTFWFYMTLKAGDQIVRLPLPEQMQKVALERSLQSGLKRFSKGFIKTIGIIVPGTPEQFGAGGSEFAMLRENLGDSYSVEQISLDKGSVPSNVDLLLLVAPERVSSQQLFAIDQFLMKGGTVIVATSPFAITIDKALNCRRVDSGLDNWLKKYGIDIQKTMVLDNQNFPLPIPTRRVISGFTVEEAQLAPYPYFIDIRRDGMAQEDHITAGINQLIMSWASPITIDREVNKQRRILELLHSSPDSWTASETSIDPNYSEGQPLGFPVGKEKGAKLLAVDIEGSFDSYFKDNKSPLLESKPDSTGAGANNNSEPQSPRNGAINAAINGAIDGAVNGAMNGTINGAQKGAPLTNIIDKSPDSARIMVFASNTFLSDKLLWLASESLGSRYAKPVELIHNAADWSLEDRDLLSIRGRGHFTRTLRPMSQGFEVFFEYLNYGLALVGLAAVWLIRRRFWSRIRKRYDQLLLSISKPINNTMQHEQPQHLEKPEQLKSEDKHDQQHLDHAQNEEVRS